MDFATDIARMLRRIKIGYREYVVFHYIHINSITTSRLPREH
jgi:hypothetical protein